MASKTGEEGGSEGYLKSGGIPVTLIGFLSTADGDEAFVRSSCVASSPGSRSIIQLCICQPHILLLTRTSSTKSLILN